MKRYKDFAVITKTIHQGEEDWQLFSQEDSMHQAQLVVRGLVNGGEVDGFGAKIGQAKAIAVTGDWAAHFDAIESAFVSSESNA